MTFDLVYAILYVDEVRDFPSTSSTSTRRERDMSIRTLKNVLLACVGVGFFWLLIVAMTGCASRTVGINNAGTYAEGDLATVSVERTTIRTTNPDGSVTVESRLEEVKSAKTSAVAKHEERLAELEAKVAIAQAKYSQPKVVYSSPSRYYDGGYPSGRAYWGGGCGGTSFGSGGSGRNPDGTIWVGGGGFSTNSPCR